MEQNALQQIAETIRDLVNPLDLVSGAKIEHTLCADNIVVFKRTSTAALKQPQGIAHNYHHRFELLIPLEREGRVHIDGASYQLAPGMIYLMFPHQFHHFLAL
jgi:mannose-6-phosphate isomerase-like protein (cupin superfamily)